MKHRPSRQIQSGFTLIELSIVLVIIGLIVGGILAGRDLVRAAELRRQMRQIEDYRTSVHIFKSKYNGLPGDLPGQDFGFVARSGNSCNGNNDGILLSCYTYSPIPWTGGLSIGGESTLFWSDLAKANLISGTYAVSPNLLFNLQEAQVGSYLPAAKLGNSQFVHAFSDGASNFFALSQIIGTNGSAFIRAKHAIIPLNAFAIDSKMDDGLPNAGRVVSISNTISSQLSNQFDNPGFGGFCAGATAYKTMIDNPRCSLKFGF